MSAKLKLICLLLLIAMLVPASNVFANHKRGEYYHDRSITTYRPLNFYFGGGYGYGGNEVGRFEDGSGDIEKVRGGGGLLLEGGLLFAVDPVTAIRLTAGYQVDGVSRLNGDSSFDRMRFDLTFIRSVGSHELGVGVTAHTSVGYQCNINAICAGDVEFDSAMGYTLEYAINLSKGYYGGYRYPKQGSRGLGSGSINGIRIGLRFTGVEYKPRLANIDSTDIVDGSSLSAFVGVSF